MTPVLNAFVDDGGTEIVLIEQTGPKGYKERRIPARYTSYHRREDVSNDLMRMLKHADPVSHIVYDGDDWVRIGWKNFQLRRQAYWKFKDDGVETFEGDVDPVRWFLTETKTPIAKPRRCYLDIETDSRVPFSKKEEMRVLCWTISDDTGPVARGMIDEDTDEEETRILEELWAVLEKYDQVNAWFGGNPIEKNEGFDFYVIAQRSRRMGLPVDTRRWLWLDQLVVWRRMNSAESGEEKQSMKLEDIAQIQLGEGKEKAPDWVVEKFGEKGLGALAWDLWFAGGKYRQLLVDYCAKDTELLRKLEKKKGFITLFQTLCEVCSVFGNTQGLFPTGQMDGFLLRLGREQNYRFRTKIYSDEERRDDKFKGAFVLAPRTVASSDDRWTEEDARKWREEQHMEDGILRNVHVCDFASLYPSNIITWNLSEDTKVREAYVINECELARAAGKPFPHEVCRSPGTGIYTWTNKIGILSLALRKMLQMRKKYADEAATYPPGTPAFIDAMAISTAYKVAANSFYGVVGASTSRYFDRELAESTTQNGVWLIQHVMEEAKKRGIISVAGDTDSAYVIGPTRRGFDIFVKWLNEKHLPRVIAETGAKDSFVKLAYEKEFDVLAFSAAKKYTGRYVHYKWKSTCNHCQDAKGNPGSVDVRTLTCGNCNHQYTTDPIFIGKPEIKGLEYRRGDASRLARELQGQIIDMLVGGLHTNDDINDSVSRPVLDHKIYELAIEKMRQRVLSLPLSIDEVKQAKGITKDSLKEYGGSKADDGRKETIPAHIVVAKILEARGESVTKGTRVEYVVVDGDSSPMKAIPASDYNGDCDRFYLWDTLVYPPTQRLLEGTFPNANWSRFGDVRPPKPKGSARKVPENQLGFGGMFNPPEKGATTIVANDYDLAVPSYSARPLVVQIPESGGERTIKKIEKVLRANPGARSVLIEVQLNTGNVAVLKSKIRVSTGAKLAREVQDVITSLASHENA